MGGSSILMQWAEGGSLEELINTRSGKSSHDLSDDDDSSMPDSGQEDLRSRSARIRAFRKRQHASPSERREADKKRRVKRGAKAVHLFSAVEIKNLFSDIVNGLGFLVGPLPSVCVLILMRRPSLARKVCSTSRSQASERTPYLGRRKSNVR